MKHCGLRSGVVTSVRVDLEGAVASVGGCIVTTATHEPRAEICLADKRIIVTIPYNDVDGARQSVFQKRDPP